MRPNWEEIEGVKEINIEESMLDYFGKYGLKLKQRKKMYWDAQAKHAGVMPNATGIGNRRFTSRNL